MECGPCIFPKSEHYCQSLRLSISLSAILMADFTVILFSSFLFHGHIILLFLILHSCISRIAVAVAYTNSLVSVIVVVGSVARILLVSSIILSGVASRSLSGLDN